MAVVKVRHISRTLGRRHRTHFPDWIEMNPEACRKPLQVRKITRLVPRPVQILSPAGDYIGLCIDEWPYEPLLIRVAMRLAKDGPFVDVGAHIGNHEITWASNGRSVIAVEPNPGIAAVLKQNIDRNGLRQMVALHALALGSHAGSASIESSDSSNSGMARVVIDDDGDVQIGRYDDFFSQTRVQLVKIDAEFMELDVLHGMTETLNSSRPWLIVECNSSVSAVKLFLAKYNYWFIPISLASSPTYLFVPQTLRGLRVLYACDLLLRALYVDFKRKASRTDIGRNLLSFFRTDLNSK